MNLCTVGIGARMEAVELPVDLTFSVPNAFYEPIYYQGQSSITQLEQEKHCYMLPSRASSQVASARVQEAVHSRRLLWGDQNFVLEGASHIL